MRSEGKSALYDTWMSGKFDGNFWFLMLCFLFMPLNWWLESTKWRWLMSPHISMSTFSALKTVLAGVAAGIMTPARLGEYGGRLVTSDPELKTQVVSATLLGSIAQNLCNIVVGLGFSYFFLKNVFGVTYGQGIAFSIIVSIQIFLMVWFYYNLPKVAHFIEQYVNTKYTNKISKQIKTLDLYQKGLLHRVLAISFMRYCIYFCQYVLFMMFLGINVEKLTLFSNISGIYLVQTGIPLPGFLSVFARGELALLVWSSVGVDSVTALVATFGLWLINLILPSLVGVVILLGTDFKKYFTK
jgi:hypothetical protein